MQMDSQVAFYNGDNTREIAMAVRGNFDFDIARYPHVKLLICDGDVIVSGGDFKGLIIASGDVVLQSNVSSDYVAVEQAFAGTAVVGGETISTTDLFNNVRQNSVEGSEIISDKNWDITELVYYKNWRKQ